MSLSERLAVPCYVLCSIDDDDASGPWLACAVHNIRVDFAPRLFFCYQSAPQAPGRRHGVLLQHILVFWCLAAGRTLRSQKVLRERDGICDRRGSSGPPPAETGWDLYLPSLERARARQGSVLQPFSLSTRTCGRALTFPEVDASSALTNGPRFKYTLPSQLRCSRRSFCLAKPRSCSTSFYLSGPRLTTAAYHLRLQLSVRFLGVEIIFQRSTVKFTSLAFARQPFPTHTHSAFIFLCDNKHELRSLSWQPSKTLGHGAGHACEAFGCDYFGLDYPSPLGGRVFEESSRNFAAPVARFALPNPAQAPSNLISATHGLRPQRVIFVSSFRSMTKSTSLPFARQLPITHSALIFRRGRTSESSFISSHRSRSRFSVTVPDIHVKLLLRSFSTWVSKVSTALASLSNTAATPLLPALVLPCQTKLELDQLLSQRPMAYDRSVSPPSPAFGFSDSEEFSKDPRPGLPPWPTSVFLVSGGPRLLTIPPHKAHQLSSQPSKALGHCARHACEAFATIIFDLCIESLHRARSLEEYCRISAPRARSALPNPAR
ncbi:hypothetical protein DFH06DRAFT_1323572 [Mycena polygramma]|nr:hypothetical protein DFH06DRAFT_1323572 [Mycena polygramma]